MLNTSQRDLIRIWWMVLLITLGLQHVCSINSSTEQHEINSEPEEDIVSVQKVVVQRAVVSVNATPDPYSHPPEELKGRKGYMRYHANDTYIGWPVNCTREEKICFKYNLLYYPRYGACVPLESDTNCKFQINREEFQHRSGHIVAEDKACNDPCDNYGYRMAYDGQCHSVDAARNVFCACNQSELTLHFLGGFECRCWEPQEVKVRQPEEDGLCKIPDLRFPDAGYSRRGSRTNEDIPRWSHYPDSFKESKLRLDCSSSRQWECFRAGRVWMPDAEGCASLLRQGPCRSGHVVALSRTAAQDGYAQGVCVHERGGCPSGQHRHVEDGYCHDELEVRLVWTNYKNEFGEVAFTDGEITNRLKRRPFILLGVEGNECIVLTGLEEYSILDDDFKAGAVIVYEVNNTNIIW